MIFINNCAWVCPQHESKRGIPLSAGTPTYLATPTDRGLMGRHLQLFILVLTLELMMLVG